MRLLSSKNFYWRLVVSFLLLVGTILLLFSLAFNKIFSNYIAQDEETQFNYRVETVVNELSYYTDLRDLTVTLPRISRLTGVKLELVTERSDMINLLDQTDPNKIVGHKKVSFFDFNSADNSGLVRYIPFTQYGEIVAILKVKPNGNLSPARSDLNFALFKIAILGMFLSLVLAFALSRSLSKPLVKLTMAVREVSKGNLSHRVPEDRDDELGILGHQFNVMSEKLNESFNLLKEERDRLKEFIADVSHELKTPLTALNTFNELLLEDVVGDENTRKEFLENSSIQIKRLDKISENLLQLSKLDSGLIKMNLVPSNLLDTVESSLDGLRVLAANKNIKLNRHYHENNLMVSHDPFFFEQVIDNIVGNAIKYSPSDSEVDIQISKETRESGSWAVLKIWDQGEGIPVEDLDKLFKRFYRGKHRSKNEPGTGLGLAIARSIVEAHGGCIEVTKPSKAEFTILLPMYN